MGQLPSLFEALSRDAIDSPSVSTHITESDGDEYDAPGHLLAQLDCDDGVTLQTRVDGETYDDDPGVGHLMDPRPWESSTRKTSSDGETYDDDPGTSGLAYPHQ